MKINSLSIIIPTLNEEENIGQLLPHLIENNQGAEIEIIVVDAGSSDATCEMAENLGALVIPCEVKSRAVQMNLGAQVANNEILYFVHADTLPPASYYTDIHQALDSGLEMGCYRFRFNSQRWLLKINSWFTRFNRLVFRGGDQTFFISKRNFQRIGGYNPAFVVMEEYDFLIRAGRTLKFGIIPKEVFVSARKYDSNSYLRVNFANFIVFNMFKLGFEPTRIQNTYYKLIKHPKGS